MARRPECCPGCMPKGVKGAFFELEPTYPNGFDNEVVWMKVCTNCGYEKKPRKRRVRPSFDEITRTLESADKLNVADKAKFHYFNPNGARAKLNAARNAYREANTSNTIPYLCSFINDYDEKQLWQQMQLKRPKLWNVNYHVEGMLETAKRITELVEKL